MGLFFRGYRFLRYNEHKRETLKAYFWSGIYRYQILYKPSKKLKPKWGIAGEESPKKASLDDYRYAKKVSYAVNQVCSKTKWESKCLVRALTAQKLLAEKGIESTMYLGVKEDGNHKMVAHSWIRVGRVFVTGGNGVADGYAVVDKFRSRISKKR